MPQDGSTNWNLPLRYDVTPDESDDADDGADEMVQDYVADLPLECAICVTNARGMAFLCGHTTCVECGERLDRCPICREPIIYRIRLFLE
nr:e3 ubiquitin-protein ligase rglg3 [Quercus suber]